jgi:hypothetical protein
LVIVSCKADGGHVCLNQQEGKTMFEIYADGILWCDSDGITEFSMYESGAIARSLEEIGYEIELVEV